MFSKRSKKGINSILWIEFISKFISPFITVLKHFLPNQYHRFPYFQTEENTNSEACCRKRLSSGMWIAVGQVMIQKSAPSNVMCYQSG